MGTKVTGIDLSDPRVRRTRRLLREALIGLIPEKDYRAITIKDITDRAEVAYITFFRHYDSIDDLLLEALEGGLSELQVRVQEATRQAGDCMAEGQLIFEYVQENATLFKILLNTPGALHIRKRFQAILAENGLSTCEALHGPAQAIPPEIMANQLAASVLSLIEEWLDQDMPYPCEQMGEIYSRLRAGLLTAVGPVQEGGQG